MSEIDAGDKPRFDRSSREYLLKALEHAFSITPIPPTVGISMEKPPESFTELLTRVEAARHPECSMSNEIDGIIEIIAACSDPDEIVRALPYDTKTGSVVFILPDAGEI